MSNPRDYKNGFEFPEVGGFDLEMAVVDLLEESEKIGVVESEEVPPAVEEVVPEAEIVVEETPAEPMPWTSMHEAMLMAEIQDMVWGGPHLAELAVKLRTTIDELTEIRDLIPTSQWFEKRSDVILDMERAKMRGFNWDMLEHGVLEKLSLAVRTRAMSNGELLQIARVANQATRRGIGVEEVKTPAAAQNQGGFHVQIINGVAVNVPVETGLPGPGSLGTIKLTLSQRTVKQLSQERIIDGTSERIMDNSEFLTSKDIPELNGLIDSNE